MEKSLNLRLEQMLELAGGDLVGGRVRRIRERQGLSLRDVADRAEVSKNTVLRLEQGMMPRVSTLRQVAKALRVKPTVLCALDLIESPVISEQKSEDLRWNDMDNYRGSDHPLFDGPLSREERRGFSLDGTTVFANLKSGVEGNFFHPNIIELYSSTPRRSHPGMEFCYVLEGSVALVFENDRRVLHVDESISFHSTEVHHYEVVGDVLPVRLLSIIVYFGEGVKDKASHWGWVQRKSE